MLSKIIRIVLVVVMTLFLSWGESSAESTKLFPFEVHKQTLSNNLDVIVIPMPEFKNFLSFNAMVMVGSRNETEKGHSGEAHLFEHILFRHQYGNVPNGYNQEMDKTGAHNNAWTWNDMTYYHPLTFSEFTEMIFTLESDRLINLNITRKLFETEAGAVDGEYKRWASDPSTPIEEALFSLMYPQYGYGHTVIGYLDDIKAMPEHYDHAMQFYQDYYVPSNTVLVISGDVKVDRILELAEKYFGGWVDGEIKPIPDPVDSFGGPHRKDLDFPTEAPPRVWVTYRMPPHQSGSTETAVGQLLPTLLTHRTAPLYKRLRTEKAVASNLSCSSFTYETFGPGQFVVDTECFLSKYEEGGDALLEEVRVDVQVAVDELKQFSQRSNAVELLEKLKQKWFNDQTAGLDSPAIAAGTFVWHYRFERDLDAMEKLASAVASITTADIEAFAEKYFVPDNQIVVTLAKRGGGEEGTE